MGKNNRREVAKRLTQQIAETKDDPQTLIELTKQLAKVLPKRRQSAERPQRTPRADGRQVLSRVMNEIEKQRRDKNEVLASLSPKEREAFNEFSGWGI